MRVVLAGLVGALVASCDAPVPAPDNPAEAPQVPEQVKTPISIRTMAGQPEQEAFLVEPSRAVPLDQLADAVRETGSRCTSVTAFNQLEQNGRVMDVYKIECAEGSYQVTVVEGSTHIKPWTGNIFGS